MQPPLGPPVWAALKALPPGDAAADLVDDLASVMPIGTSIRPVLTSLPASANTLVPRLCSVPMSANQSAPRA
jgi:hypothetical protein